MNRRPLYQPAQLTRRDRMAQLVRDYFAGRQVDCANAGMASTYANKPNTEETVVSGWCSGARAISDSMARRLELTYGLDVGWLDARDDEGSDTPRSLPHLVVAQASTALRTRSLAFLDEAVAQFGVAPDVVSDHRFAITWTDDTMAAGPRAIAPGAGIVACLRSAVRHDDIVLAQVNDELLLRRIVISGTERFLDKPPTGYGTVRTLARNVVLARVVLADKRL